MKREPSPPASSVPGANPVSLAILQARQAEEDRKFAKIKARDGEEIRIESMLGFGEEEEDDGDNLPF